jgi:MFS transporter, AAHS family, 4-hydroxybenzoate transporter
MYAGVAVGAAFAGLVASYLLPHYGWQSLFLAGGIVACLIGLIAVFLMPETLPYLVQKGRDKDKAQIYRIVSRIAPTHIPDKETIFVLFERELPGAPVVHLFKEGRAWNTVLLWMAFILSYYLLWLILSWTPTLLKESGASPQEFSLAFACINSGWAVAIVSIGMLMDKYLL